LFRLVRLIRLVRLVTLVNCEIVRALDCSSVGVFEG